MDHEELKEALGNLEFTVCDTSVLDKYKPPRTDEFKEFEERISHRECIPLSPEETKNIKEFISVCVKEHYDDEDDSDDEKELLDLLDSCKNLNEILCLMCNWGAWSLNETIEALFPLMDLGKSLAWESASGVDLNFFRCKLVEIHGVHAEILNRDMWST